MSKIAIVTDSTCDFGPEWLADRGVVMVPLKVNFGDQSYRDWVDLAPEDFFSRLATAKQLPKTSQPSPADFAAVYGSLGVQGFTEIVSIHLSAALSGTVESALLAAKDATIPVHVVDTHTVNMGTGLAIVAAIEARDAGQDVDEILRVVNDVVAHARLLFALDTLDYLVKGGRAGKAQGLAASVLNIKPVLTFNREGTIEPFAKVKGTKKAIAEIAAAVAAEAGSGKVRVATLASIAPDLTEQLEQALIATGADIEIIHHAEVGAVIGTYAGPRAIGAAFCRVP